MRDLVQRGNRPPQFVFAVLASTHYPYKYPPEYERHRPIVVAEYEQHRQATVAERRRARTQSILTMNAADFERMPR